MRGVTERGELPYKAEGEWDIHTAAWRPFMFRQGLNMQHRCHCEAQRAEAPDCSATRWERKPVRHEIATSQRSSR
jgi:hypothetical protein